MSEKVLTTEVIKHRKQANQATPQEEHQVVPDKPQTPLEKNFYNLLQLVVRYGERPIQMDGDLFTIGEVIIYTLEGDEITPPRPVYKSIMEQFKLHYKDKDFKAEEFFKLHPDPAISGLAIDIIADKYQLWNAEKEEHLGELVTQQLYEIKLTVINNQIDDLETRLKQAQADGDQNLQLQLLAYQPALISQRNEICKLLGNRVINL